MTEHLKVKVLKKSKDAPYPEHIIVERKSTHEMAHLYFDDGVIKRLTHIARDPEIKMAWDEKEKKYKTLLPNYFVVHDITYKKNKFDDYFILKGPANQNFCIAFSTPPWDSKETTPQPSPNSIRNQRIIAFQTFPDSIRSDLFIKMDLKGKCIPNGYIGTFFPEEIQEVYPHQARKTCPLSQLIAKGVKTR